MKSAYDSCMCGDSRDDHGHDPKHQGSTACRCDGCPCFAFELNEDAEDDDGGEP